MATRRTIAWSIVGGVAAVLTVLLLAKPPGPQRAHSDVVVPPQGPILYSGCAVVRQSTGCELPASGTLRVWLPTPDGHLTSEPETVQVSERSELDRGALLHLDIPIAVRELHSSAGMPAGKAWRLDIIPASPADEVLRNATSLRRAGRAQEAALAIQVALDDATGERRARYVGLLARIAADQGEMDRARGLFMEAIALHRASGAVSLAADDGFALAYYLIQHHRLAEGREAVSAIEDLAMSYPDGAARLRFYRGHLAAESGDLRSALGLLLDAERQSHRMGLASVELMTVQVLNSVFVALGRSDDALDRLERLQAEPTLESCQRADVAANIGWVHLRALLRSPPEASAARRIQAEHAFRESLRLYQTSCPNDLRLADAQVVLAWTLLAGGDVSAARRELDLADRRIKNPPIANAVWWLEIRGHVLLAAGDHDGALAAFDRQLELARDTSMLDVRWRAQVGRAEALARKGRLEEAIAAAREADDHLDRLALWAPLGQGRESLLSSRERSTSVLVDLLLRGDRVPEAFQRMRTARARLIATVERAERLRSLPAAARQRWETLVGHVRAERESLEQEAAQDWKLSAVALQEVRQTRAVRLEKLDVQVQHALALLDTGVAREAIDDALLAPHAIRLGFVRLEGRWVVFAERPDGVRTYALPLAEAPRAPIALASSLLALAADSIDEAGLVLVHATGELKSVDFHALPWGDSVLIASKTVAYSLDVGTRASTAAPPSRAALLVADPNHDLLHARGEINHVRESLGSGWNVRALVGDEARARSVVDALPSVSLFHYAGHGEVAGRDAWDSRLPLASGSSLALSDILSLASSPPHVVLSGCDAARVDSGELWMGLGLAQAFIVSGAEDVIAPARIVDDTLARAMAEALYGVDASDGSAPERLARAQRAIMRDQPALDWSAYRAVVR